MLGWLRPLAKIAAELRRIASALEYFAIADAQSKGRMYILKQPKWQGKDESELFHTDNKKIVENQKERLARFTQGGSRLLEQDEVDD